MLRTRSIARALFSGADFFDYVNHSMFESVPYVDAGVNINFEPEWVDTVFLFSLDAPIDAPQTSRFLHSRLPPFFSWS